MAKKVVVSLLALVIICFAVFIGFLYQARHSDDIAFLNEVRYQQGEHKRAMGSGRLLHNTIQYPRLRLTRSIGHDHTRS